MAMAMASMSFLALRCARLLSRAPALCAARIPAVQSTPPPAGGSALRATLSASAASMTLRAGGGGDAGGGGQSAYSSALAAVAGAGVASLGVACTLSAESASKSRGGKEGAASVTLYQYAVCPFCNKVRATLDYYDVPYRVVEVNPLFRGEIKWSENYKKVPIVTIEEDKLTKLVDSSDIMRELKVKYEKRGGPMFGRAKAKDEEDQWLKWVDSKLVHYLSPNIYRTSAEAMQAFDYITQEGNFGFWEREAARYAGAGAMYVLTHTKLKKKHKIVKEREELYEKLEEFCDAVGNRDFLGGSRPNLADLAVFGVLRAIQGMDTFTDVMSNTRIQPWYARMVEQVGAPSRVD